MVGYTPCEDPEYAFAVGRVRAREARMFARSQFDRLADSRNENQIISALADTPYGELHAENTVVMLSRSEAEEEAFFARYLTDEKVAGFFSTPKIASNLKWAIRKHFGAEIDEDLFIAETASTPEAFEMMLAGEESGLPDWIRETAGEVIAENYQDVNPASIDTIID
ncbi:hypothetical protein GF359_00785, partial [candidate division WOR-3 bacterium]|nr:hypothetical protein [candidate division WOR-3 bacterium]MBD3363729.1 hypothetical protein [candidate division WOR-3 bacterium]